MYTYYPLRRNGLILLGIFFALVLLVNVWNIYLVTQATSGPAFLQGLVIALIAPIPLPWLAYRFWALQNASYTLQRDGIQLRWGMRAVDIPMTEVEWVRADNELQMKLPLPWMHLPGAIIGMGRHLAGGLPIEFFAERTRGLILIATSEKIYTISPAETQSFIQLYAELSQFGSLEPIPARSVYPSFWLSNIWQLRPVRNMLISVIVLNLILVTWVSLVSTTYQEISLGFDPEGLPLPPLPATALWIIPFLNFISSLADWILGLFLYRSTKYRHLAYVLWVSSLFIAVLFLGALYYILQTGG